MSTSGGKVICNQLGPQLQELINQRKNCHSIIMNLLTHEDDTKGPTFLTWVNWLHC